MLAWQAIYQLTHLPRASFDGVSSVLRYMMSGDVPSALQVDMVTDPGQLKTLVWLLKNYVRAPHQDGLMIL